MKIIKIEKCGDCPYMQMSIALPGPRCFKMHRREVEESESPPDWCPLDEENKPLGYWVECINDEDCNEEFGRNQLDMAEEYFNESKNGNSVRLLGILKEDL